MVFIDMYVAEGVDEFADFAAQETGDDVAEERIRSDIERDAEKDVRGALIELERHFLIFDVHLIHVVADGKMIYLLGLRHRIEVLRIPACHDSVVAGRGGPHPPNRPP